MANTNPTILVVDDEEKFLNFLVERLQLLGYQALRSSNGEQAIELAKKNRIDLAIVDLKMPGMDGLVTITKLKEIYPELNSVLLTGHGSKKVKQATEALEAFYFEKDQMKSFWDFIKKTNMDGNTIVIRPPANQAPPERTGEPQHGQSNPARVEIVADHPSGMSKTAFIDGEKGQLQTGGSVQPRIIGETKVMQELRRNIERLAALDCSVIIRGETGTGKELTARLIHHSSPRKNNRFIALNCGCFDNDLLIEELFTPGNRDFDPSAQAARTIGAYESGATILLDQIEDMSPKMQLSMLKIIDSKKVFVRDDGDHFPFDLRIIAASHHNLRKLAEEGKFREELYHRLNVFEFFIPPLRERRDDIPPLSNYFLSNYAADFKKEVKYISEDVISIFMSYSFPGNVRELEHIVERAVILADGQTLEPRHLPKRFQQSVASPVDLTKKFLSLAEMEKRHILEVLEATGNSKSKAVEVLGISRAALWRKLKQFKESAAQEESQAGARKDHQ